MDNLQAGLALGIVLSALLDAIEWVVTLPVTVFHGYSSLVRWAADGVRSLFESYGYWVVFFGTLFENTLFLGLIVPGALVVLLAGLSAHDGTISIPLAVLLGTAGTIIGDTISYSMGRFGWSRFGQSPFFRDLEAKVRRPLLRRGPLFVLFYHFAGYTRVIGPAAAGFFKMPYSKWAPADYGGAFLWICGYLSVGYGLGVLGLTLDSTDRWFRFFEWGLLVVVLIVSYKVYRAAQSTWYAYQNPRSEEGESGNITALPDEARREDGATASVGVLPD